MNLNGTDYYYLYNAQGDVIALYDSTGTIVTEYKYDSWGKLLSTTGSGASTIGAMNPIRYRGYFYDTDLGFYLLETRYYDPETGRFINADDIVDNLELGTQNIYAYCKNNPILYRDIGGENPVLICVAAVAVSAIIGGLTTRYFAGITAQKNNYNKKDTKKAKNRATAIGAVGGAAATTIGLVSGGAAVAAWGAKTAISGITAYASSRYTRPKRGVTNKKTYTGVKGTVQKINNKIRYSDRTRDEIKQDRAALLAGLVSGAMFMGIGTTLDSAFANSQASVDIVANQIADSIIGGDLSGLQYALSEFFELFLGD